MPLDAGANRVATRLYAGDRALYTDGPGVDVRRAGAAPAAAAAPAPAEVPAGRLYVLAVGVDDYGDPARDLRFAAADARAVAAEMEARGGGLFERVEARVLLDGEATRAGVLAAVEDVAARARPEDTFVLYLAGHGLRSEPDGRFLYITHGVRDFSSWAGLRRDALEDGALVAAVARVRARDGVILVDTCYAGGVALDALGALGVETGRYLIAASNGVQEALDSYDDRNGVFAYALREGLRGRAGTDGEGRVSALVLGDFLLRRVPRLAAERGHRQDAVFRTSGADLRGFPLALAPRAEAR